MITELIGYLAILLTVSASIPQIIKLHKEKTSTGISLGYYYMLLSGIVCWLVYGISISSAQLIIANVISIMIISYTIFMVIKHRKE